MSELAAPPKFMCLMCGKDTYSRSCVCGACVQREPSASAVVVHKERREAMLIGAPPSLHGATVPLGAGPGTPGRLVYPGAGTFVWIGRTHDGKEIYAYEKGSKDGSGGVPERPARRRRAVGAGRACRPDV